MELVKEEETESKQKMRALWKKKEEERKEEEEENIDQKGVSLTTDITEALNEYCPRRKMRRRSRRWWTEEVAEKRKEVRKKIREHKRSGRDWTREALKKATSELRRQIRKSRKDGWNRFLQEATEEEVWRATAYTRTPTSNIVPTLNGENGDIWAEIGQKRDILLKEEFPPAPVERVEKPRLEEGSMEEEIEEEEVKEALWNQSQKTAPGPDNIGFRAIRILWEFIGKKLTSLTEETIRRGHHPMDLKTVKGEVIRKPGKPDYSKPRAYRVISLINCISKVVEKVVTVRITRRLKETSKLHKRQMGFRGKRSTIDALAEIIHRTEEAWKEKEYMLLLMMDVKEAFPHVSRNRLANTMKKLEVPDYLIRWTLSWMENGKAVLAIAGEEESEKFEVNTGIP